VMTMFSVVGVGVVWKVVKDARELKWPREYVLADGTVEREQRPLSDVFFHLVLFKWGLLGDGRLFDSIMARVNREFLEWDRPFPDGQAEAIVYGFCSKWGVPREPWVWSKPVHEYKTLNDWFTRKHASEHAPENNLGEAEIVTPATAVVTWFPSVSEMPKLVKNDAFTVEDCGLPKDFVEGCQRHPCTLHYLAPADYHCYHAPISGTITTCEVLTKGRYSVTVKPYIFSSINILKRNRRAVLVIDSGKGLQMGIIIIGGVTVDSIRLESSVKAGGKVQKGQLLGAFARGGSSIACFFTMDRSKTVKTVQLEPTHASIVARGQDFKVECGRSLAAFR